MKFRSCKFFNLPAILFMLTCLTNYGAGAQSMGISSSSITPDASSILEMRTNTKGLLIPRMTTTERNAISSPATGLMVYNSTTNAFNYYNGTAWTIVTTGSTSAVNSVSGTTNRVSLGGTATDPIVDISSAYAGQNSITTVGTIGTGTWNGSVIGSAYGGAGTVSGILKANGTGTVSAASAGDYPTLNQNTTGSAATLTTSRNIHGGSFNGSADVTNIISAVYGGTGNGTYTTGDLLFASASTTLSKLAGVASGNVLLSGGVGTAPAWGKVGLTTHVSGLLPIANGGTNSTATPTAGAVAYGNGTAYQFSAAGNVGQVLISNGTGAPAWTDGGAMMLSGLSNNATVNNKTLYFPLSGIATGENAEVSAGTRTMVSRSGTIRNLIVRLDIPLASSKTGTVTVLKNGVATLLNAAVTVGLLLFSDNFNSFTVVAGDELSIRVTTTGNVRFSWAVDFSY
jgi:hypothetical protein